MRTAEIGVAVQDGVVTLSGTVDSYFKKNEAELITKNVVGVKAVAEDIKVSYDNSFTKTDTEIAHEILNSWKWNWEIPHDKITVKVEDGWVRLDGQVQWNTQKEAAQKAITNLIGVKGIANFVTIQSESQDTVEKSEVTSAIERSASLHAHAIKVEVLRDRVKLSGIVHSLYQKEEAARLAWNAPGVCSVDNELAVIY